MLMFPVYKNLILDSNERTKRRRRRRWIVQANIRSSKFEKTRSNSAWASRFKFDKTLPVLNILLLRETTWRKQEEKVFQDQVTGERLKRGKTILLLLLLLLRLECNWTKQESKQARAKLEVIRVVSRAGSRQGESSVKLINLLVCQQPRNFGSKQAPKQARVGTEERLGFGNGTTAIRSI